MSGLILPGGEEYGYDPEPGANPEPPPAPRGRFSATIEITLTQTAMWGTPDVMAAALKATLHNELARIWEPPITAGQVEDVTVSITTTGLEIINAQG